MLKILAALAVFRKFILDNYGKPIDLRLVSALADLELAIYKAWSGSKKA